MFQRPLSKNSECVVTIILLIFYHVFLVAVFAKSSNLTDSQVLEKARKHVAVRICSFSSSLIAKKPV